MNGSKKAFDVEEVFFCLSNNIQCWKLASSLSLKLSLLILSRTYQVSNECFIIISLYLAFTVL